MSSVTSKNQSIIANEPPLIKGNPTFSSISDKICGIVENKPPSGWWILFLASLSLFENPELTFKDDFVVMTESNAPTKKSLKYWYSDPSVVTTPTKEITMPSTEVTFTLTGDLLSDVTKAAAVIGAPDMVLEGMDLGSAVLKVADKKNDTSNNYAQHLDIWYNKGDKNVPYKFWFKVENLKLLPGSYNVQVSSKKISYFKNSNVDVEYFIALEPESSYDV